MDIVALAGALEASAFAGWVRGSGLTYAVVNLLHLLGLVLLIGPILLLDLRLLGAGRAFDAAAVSRVLTPWLLAGVMILLASGSALFSADAVPLIGNPVFLLKVGLLAVAVINAVLFRLLWTARLADWDRAPPRVGQAQAALSIGLWLAIATAGRLIAYL